jgi:hypothetical protein
LDFSGIADLPGLTRTGHYQPDGTFADWQSRTKSVSRTMRRFVLDCAEFQFRTTPDVLVGDRLTRSLTRVNREASVANAV